MSDDARKELDDLLIARATQGLSSSERDRLDELLNVDVGEVDADWIDRIVGELDAAWAGAEGATELPEHLVAALMAQPNAEMASERKGSLRLVHGGAQTADGDERDSTPEGEAGGTHPRFRRSRTAAWMGWATAAALVLTWVGIGRGGGEPQSPSFADLALVEGALVRPWTATEDPAAAGAGGEVVWVESLQQGAMRFSGLEPNDPTVFQYQLWIFDAERDERYPVDGGVFDVPADGSEAEVPIRAKLPVGAVTLFAVTVEPPGGVVVSSRDRIALVAQAAEE